MGDMNLNWFIIFCINCKASEEKVVVKVEIQVLDRQGFVVSLWENLTERPFVRKSGLREEETCVNTCLYIKRLFSELLIVREKYSEFMNRVLELE